MGSFFLMPIFLANIACVFAATSHPYPVDIVCALSAPAFGSDNVISEKQVCGMMAGEMTSPELRLSMTGNSLAFDESSMMIIVRRVKDSSAYWIMYDIPSNTTLIPADQKKGASFGYGDQGKFLNGAGDWKNGAIAGYSPMCSSDPQYSFTLYWLSTPSLDLPPGARMEQVQEAATDSIVKQCGFVTSGYGSKVKDPSGAVTKRAILSEGAKSMFIRSLRGGEEPSTARDHAMATMLRMIGIVEKATVGEEGSTAEVLDDVQTKDSLGDGIMAAAEEEGLSIPSNTIQQMYDAVQATPTEQLKKWKTLGLPSKAEAQAINFAIQSWRDSLMTFVDSGGGKKSAGQIAEFLSILSKSFLANYLFKGGNTANTGTEAGEKDSMLTLSDRLVNSAIDNLPADFDKKKAITDAFLDKFASATMLQANAASK